VIPQHTGQTTAAQPQLEQQPQDGPVQLPQQLHPPARGTCSSVQTILASHHPGIQQLRWSTQIIRNGHRWPSESWSLDQPNRAATSRCDA
jgi:hypothetical protein